MTRIKVAAGLVLNDHDEALMTLRPEGSRRPLLWEYPGGKREAYDENLMVTLAREWKEELGVELNLKRTHLITTIDLFVEEHFEVSLYQTEFMLDSRPPVPREGQDMVWANVAWSIQHRQMVPSCYTLYRKIMDIIRRREDGRRG